MDIFDLSRPETYSAAARELAEREQHLNTQIAAVFEEAAQASGSMTKAQLADAITARGGTPGTNATSAELAAQYNRIAVEADGAYQERARLYNTAGQDRYVAERLNQAHGTLVTLEAGFRDAEPGQMAGTLKWNSGDVLVAAHIAMLARKTADYTGDSRDIRKAAVVVAHQAMHSVMGLPGDAGQLTPTPAGAARIAEAQAGVQFMRIIAILLDEQVPRSLIL